MNKVAKILVGSIGATALFLSCAGFAAAANADYITSDELLPPSISGATGLGSGDLRLMIAKIIRVTMSMLGIVAVVIVLLGGFTWMTAGGNEEKVGEAKKYLYSGIIGLAIILSAYAIASFVITQLVDATTSAGTIVPGV